MSCYNHSLTFLDVTPLFTPYPAIDLEGRPLFRTSNNPAQGWCGASAISLILHGEYRQADNVRAVALQYLDEQTDTDRQELLELISDFEGAIIGDEDMAQMAALSDTLRAGPGEAIFDEEENMIGWTSELNFMGLWVTARAHDIRILVHRTDNDGNDEIGQDINAVGARPVHIYHDPALMHWDALLAEDSDRATALLEASNQAQESGDDDEEELDQYNEHT